MFDPLSMGMSVLGGIFGNRSRRKAEDRAEAANEANIRAMLASISQGKSAQLPYLEKILGIAEQRVGEEGRVAAGYDKAGKQLETGHKRGMARLAGAEGQMQELMQSMMQTALGGAIGNAPMMAMGGGSMGANLARMAAGDVMQSGAPLDIAKAAAAAESTYGTRQAGLTTEKTGATATAREGYRSGMQGALGGFADLEKWATDATVGARSGIQYRAGGGDGGGAQMGANIGMLLGMMGGGGGAPPVYGAQAPGMTNMSADPNWAGYQWWGGN
tara:strand:- start:4314 stop:5132 length:819 start_codon:yes stop_codon:yes gene_type:complete